MKTAEELAELKKRKPQMEQRASEIRSLLKPLFDELFQLERDLLSIAEPKKKKEEK